MKFQSFILETTKQLLVMSAITDSTRLQLIALNKSLIVLHVAQTCYTAKPLMTILLLHPQLLFPLNAILVISWSQNKQEETLAIKSHKVIPTVTS